jgi:hypothetical protein
LVEKCLNRQKVETLIFNLVAVNPCGLQVKKSKFHVTSVESRNNQIWNFLFEGFKLAHNSSPSTFEVFETRISKIRRVFEIFFFVILDSCFTNVQTQKLRVFEIFLHTQKLILEQIFFPCVFFRDTDTELPFAGSSMPPSY